MFLSNIYVRSPIGDIYINDLFWMKDERWKNISIYKSFV